MRGTIEICDVPGSVPPRFSVRFRKDVLVPSDDKDGTFVRGISVEAIAGGIELPSPVDWPIPNDASASLASSLPWYLESYPHQPTASGHLRASFVQKALFDWGKEVFETLFPEGPALDLFDRIALHALNPEGAVEIRSTRADILAWPWEAIIDNRNCVISDVVTVRRHVGTTQRYFGFGRVNESGPVRILMLIARDGPEDVAYRAAARPLVCIDGVEVDLVRLATLDALRDALARAAGPYDILHIDCHGSWDASGQSCLLQLSDGEGGIEDVSAAEIVDALGDTEISIVLNACRSAMAGDSTNAFDSLAVALFEAPGVLDVTAMAYRFPVSEIGPFIDGYYSAIVKGMTPALAIAWGAESMDRDGDKSLAGGYRHDTYLIPTSYVRAELVPEDVNRTPASSPRTALPPDFHGQERQIYWLDNLPDECRAVIVMGTARSGVSRFLEEWTAWRHITGAQEMILSVDCTEYATWTEVSQAIALVLGAEADFDRYGAAATLEALGRRIDWLIVDHLDHLDDPSDQERAVLRNLAAMSTVRTIFAGYQPQEWMKDFATIQGLLVSCMDVAERLPMVRHLARAELGQSASEEALKALEARLVSSDMAALLTYVAGNAGVMKWVARNAAAGTEASEMLQSLRERGVEALRQLPAWEEIEPIAAKFTILDEDEIARVVPFLSLHDEIVDWTLLSDMMDGSEEGDPDDVVTAHATLAVNGLLVNGTGIHCVLSGELRSRAAPMLTREALRRFAVAVADAALSPKPAGEHLHLTFGTLETAQQILVEEGDWNRAIGLSNMLREQFIQQGRTERAKEEAKRLLGALAAAPDEDFVAGISAVVDAAFLVGDAGMAERCLNDARWLRLAETDKGIEAVRLLDCGRIARLRGGYDEAIAHLERAVTLARQSAPRFTTTLLHEDATVLTVEEFATRELKITRALIASRTDGSEPVELDEPESGYAAESPAELRERAMLARSQGNNARALRYIDQAIRKEQRNDFTQGLAVCISSRADILASMGQIDQARLGYEEAIGHFTTLGDVRGAAISYHQWGKAAYNADLMEEAAHSLIESAKRFAECGDDATLAAVRDNFDTFTAMQPSDFMGAMFASQWVAAGLPVTSSLQDRAKGLSGLFSKLLMEGDND